MDKKLCNIKFIFFWHFAMGLCYVFDVGIKQYLPSDLFSRFFLFLLSTRTTRRAKSYFSFILSRKTQTDKKVQTRSLCKLLLFMEASHAHPRMFCISAKDVNFISHFPQFLRFSFSFIMILIPFPSRQQLFYLPSSSRFVFATFFLFLKQTNLKRRKGKQQEKTKRESTTSSYFIQFAQQ